jgi:DtxR family transcriptional regulator, Mn-dependent transcriptional regulator
MISAAEENYLKAVYKLQRNGKNVVPTGALAQAFGIQAPSVTDMVKKLAEKNLLSYEKSKGVKLTSTGKSLALTVVRKHRIWETFLVQTLEFGWDEVHDLAEQLEHIHSEELTNRLEIFLGFPKFDPHGDPIPDKSGNMQKPVSFTLKMGRTGKSYRLMGISEDSASLLQYLNKMEIGLGSVITVVNRENYDESLEIELTGNQNFNISSQVAASLLVSEI